MVVAALPLSYPPARQLHALQLNRADHSDWHPVKLEQFIRGPWKRDAGMCKRETDLAPIRGGVNRQSLLQMDRRHYRLREKEVEGREIQIDR